MKLKSLSIGTILVITLTTANASDQFSTLEGVQAEAMTSAEMDSVQGKTDIFAQIMAGTDPLGQQIAQFQQNLVQQNMGDPQIQAQYQQHLANGGGGTLAEYAYGWAATGGYTPQGYAAYGATSTQIANQYHTAIQGYWDAQQGSADALAGLNQGYFDNQVEAGYGLGGNGTFYNSYTGSNEVLPYTWQPGTVNTYNGSNYHVDPIGTYWQIDPSGYMYGVSPTYGQ
ncbi:MAG: hypothetical protein H0V34_14765 [Gammaproteobacteria bacterium]|nr:hypothetical protein [Gammaproteobacteria bacterium]